MGDVPQACCGVFLSQFLAYVVRSGLGASGVETALQVYIHSRGRYTGTDHNAHGVLTMCGSCTQVVITGITTLIACACTCGVWRVGIQAVLLS